MYKLLKPFSISSVLWAAAVTALVLLIAASANAQTTRNEPVRDNAEQKPPQQPEPLPNNAPSDRGAIRDNIASTSPRMMEVKDRMVEASEERKAMFEEKKALIDARKASLEEKRQMLENASSSRKARLSEAVQIKAQNGMARVAGVLSSAISKSRDFADRLLAKAESLEARGLDMSNAKTIIDTADRYLDQAKEALQGIDINTEYAITSDRPIEHWQDVREQFAIVRGLLKSAHENLRAAASEMKAQLINLDQTQNDEGNNDTNNNEQ